VSLDKLCSYFGFTRTPFRRPGVRLPRLLVQGVAGDVLMSSGEVLGQTHLRISNHALLLRVGTSGSRPPYLLRLKQSLPQNMAKY